MKHFVKDLGIALEESRMMGLSLPGLALVMCLHFVVVFLYFLGGGCFVGEGLSLLATSCELRFMGT